MTATTFARMVDHTLLSPTATGAEIERVCEDAIRFQTASVCVNPFWVSTVSELLKGSGVLTCSVVGFPLGAETAAGTFITAGLALEHGADEIDMVAPLGLLLAGELDAVTEHLRQVFTVADGSVFKVIIESAALTNQQIIDACVCSVDAGAGFVKTSTGFHALGGASAEAVELMRATVGPDVGVKASGGIRSLADVETMVGAGATRLGMSATASVVAELL